MSEEQAKKPLVPGPPAPLPQFSMPSTGFTPPKPPVLHPNVKNMKGEKQTNPFASRKPKTVVKTENQNVKSNPIKEEEVKPVPKEENVVTQPPVEINNEIDRESENKAESKTFDERCNADPTLQNNRLLTSDNKQQELHLEKSELVDAITPEKKVRDDSITSDKVDSSSMEASTLPSDRIDMTAGLMGWLSKTMTESKLLSDVAVKARYGMEQVIITLDPGMKGFLSRDGVVDLYVSFENQGQIKAVHEGFERVFANVLIRNVPTGKGDLPDTVYGSSYSLDMCRKRVSKIVLSRLVPADSAILVFQPFLLHFDEKLYAATRLFLQWKEHELNAITQLLEVSQPVYELLNTRSKAEGMKQHDYPITVTTAAQEVYGFKEETWAGPSPPYSFTELLTPASSAVALNFMNLSISLSNEE